MEDDSAVYEKTPNQKFVQIQVSKAKGLFITDKLVESLEIGRFFVYHLTDLSQDFKQYDAVL